MSAGLFVEEATRAIRDVIARGKFPFLAGGSGFYFRALRTGLFDAAVSPAVRLQVRSLTPSERLARLQALDPAALQPLGVEFLQQAAGTEEFLQRTSGAEGAEKPGLIHPNDEYRVARALEVVLATGIPWSQHQEKARRKPDSGEFQYRGWKLEVERSVYEEALKKRVQEMIREGLVEETRLVLEKYGEDCPGLKTLGYNFAVDVLRGRMKLDELAPALFLCHRQYGKKQRTWFRKEKALETSARAEMIATLERLNAQTRVR